MPFSQIRFGTSIWTLSHEKGVDTMTEPTGKPINPYDLNDVARETRRLRKQAPRPAERRDPYALDTSRKLKQGIEEDRTPPDEKS